MYEDLDDDAKLSLAIDFVAQGQPLPAVLEEWLRATGLFELIVSPGEYNVITGS